MQTASAALRREVDALDGRMKEDLANLKHEYVANLCYSTALQLYVTGSKWNWTVARTRQRTT